jgi:hypothetical protein
MSYSKQQKIRKRFSIEREIQHICNEGKYSFYNVKITTIDRRKKDKKPIVFDIIISTEDDVHWLEVMDGYHWFFRLFNMFKKKKYILEGEFGGLFTVLSSPDDIFYHDFIRDHGDIYVLSLYYSKVRKAFLNKSLALLPLLTLLPYARI